LGDDTGTVKKATPRSKTVSTDITVKVIPRSTRPGIVGWESDVLKVKVGAAPVEGLANKALVALLADKLRIGKGRVQIVSGGSSRTKTVRIEGLSELELKSGLAVL
jgi:uncharacterized protein (TIGR00251 family)